MPIIEIKCTYCGTQDWRNVSSKWEMENQKCDHCGDKKVLIIGESEKDRIDYYVGSPKFKKDSGGSW